MKEEALKLADELQTASNGSIWGGKTVKEGADMIRKLVAELDKQSEPVAYVNSMCNDYIDWKIEPTSIDGKPLYTAPQTKPLAYEEKLKWRDDRIAELEELVDELAGYKESYDNCHRMCSGKGMN